MKLKNFASLRKASIQKDLFLSEQGFPIIAPSQSPLTKLTNEFTFKNQESVQAISYLYGGEKGSMALGGAALLIVIALFLSLSLKHLLFIDEEFLQRKETYLCLKETMDTWFNHQKSILLSNKTIYALTAALTIKPNPVLLQLRKMTQMWQQVTTLNIWRKLLTQSKCKGLQKVFLKTTYPLKGPFLTIQRGSFGEALLKKEITSFHLPSRSFHPFLFLIKGKVSFGPPMQMAQSQEVKLY